MFCDRGDFMKLQAIIFVFLLALAIVSSGAEPSTSDIIKLSGIKAGLCVHLDVTDGKLTAELYQGGKFLVHGLASDKTSIEKARKYIEVKGIYGQVSVDFCSLKKLPYTENLINLIAVQDLERVLDKGLELQEVFRVLTPNGILCFSGKVDQEKLKAAGFTDVKVSGLWRAAYKPRPREMDDWTHYRHGPDGNKVSQDLLVDFPARLRWLTGQTWSRRHCWTTIPGPRKRG